MVSESHRVAKPSKSGDKQKNPFFFTDLYEIVVNSVILLLNTQDDLRSSGPSKRYTLKVDSTEVQISQRRDVAVRIEILDA